MKDLTIVHDTINDDGWNDAAAEANERVIRGTILKFADWRWTKGEGIELEAGTQLVALGMARGWIKWVDGKPNYQLSILVLPGKPMPEREELGDLDKSKWEPGPDGITPRDPLQNSRFVYLVDPETAEAFTFSTSSWGGRGAVADLGDQIGRMRIAHPGALPIVELSSAPMMTKFGRKSKPFFKVVGWKQGDGGTEPRVTPPKVTGGNGIAPQITATPRTEIEPPPHTEIPVFDDSISW
jgi:hypothetical protein